MSFQAKVLRKEQISPDTFLIEFGSTGAHPMPAFDPGSHADVIMSDDCIRQYSLMKGRLDPANYQIGVKREAEGRGGSRTLCDSVH